MKKQWHVHAARVRQSRVPLKDAVQHTAGHGGRASRHGQNRLLKALLHLGAGPSAPLPAVRVHPDAPLDGDLRVQGGSGGSALLGHEAELPHAVRPCAPGAPRLPIKAGHRAARNGTHSSLQSDTCNCNHSQGGRAQHPPGWWT